MKIVHVIGHYIPHLGYEENCLPAAQAQAGNEVVLVTSGRLPPDFSRVAPLPPVIQPPGMPSEEPQEVFEVRRLRSTLDISGLNALAGLRKALKELSPDVVHAHGTLSPCSIQCLGRKRDLGYALFIDDHSHPTNVRRDAIYRRGYIKGISVLYRRFGEAVASFISVTPAATEFLLRELYIPRDRIWQGALGADHIAFSPSPSHRERIRSELGIATRDTLVISTGKFSTSKNLEALILSFAKVSKHHYGVKLLLAGSGESEYLESLRLRIQSAGIMNKVIWRDLIPHDRLAGYYNAADIGVWPGAPSITVLEALSTGLPCLLPRHDLAYALVFEYNGALGFGDAGESRTLDEGLEMLVANSELREGLSKRGRLLVEQRLSWKVISTNLDVLYERGLTQP